MKPMCTMADVAKLAGVSTMTVSRSLRSGESVSPAMRDRVTQAIDDLGYIPDSTAGTLSSGHSGLIGYIVPNLHDPHFAKVADALRGTMTGASSELFMGSSNLSPEREQELVEMMLRRRVEAFAIAGSGRTDRTTALLRSAGVPIVDFLHGASAPLDHSVTINPAALADTIVSYFLERGRRRIALVTPFPGVDPAVDARARALVTEAGRQRAEPVVLLEMQGSETPIAQGARAIEAIIAGSRKVDAVVCHNDLSAYGALEQCRRLGISVPDRLAIMGFGDQELAAFSRPGITTVGFSDHSIGIEIGRILSTCLTLAERYLKPPLFRLDVDFDIIIRESA